MKIAQVFYVSLISVAMHTSSIYAKGESSFSAGLVYVSSGLVYSNAISKSRLMPSLSYEGENLNVSLQEGASYKILNGASSSFSISIAPNFKPYDRSDFVNLNGMKRNMYFDGSALVSYKIDRGLTAKFKYSMELTNEFNGNAADVSLSQFIPVAGIPVIVTAGSKWYDSNLSEFLYGVYFAETTSLRSQYAPGNVFVPYLNLNTFYKITDSVGIFAAMITNFLPAKVKNSPVVRDKNATSFVFGLGYKF